MTNRKVSPEVAEILYPVAHEACEGMRRALDDFKYAGREARLHYLIHGKLPDWAIQDGARRYHP